MTPTGDGKCMAAGHWERGSRCWVCSKDVWQSAHLAAQPVVATHARYGAFLPCIPPRCRVGDYMHCSARVLTAILLRLAGEKEHCQRSRLRKAIDGYTQHVMAASRTRGVDVATPLPGATGSSLDLSAARWCLQLPGTAEDIAALAEESCGRLVVVADGRAMVLHGVVRRLIRALQGCFHLWHVPHHLTSAQIAQHEGAVAEFRHVWQCLGQAQSHPLG